MSSPVDIIASPTLHKSFFPDSIWRRALKIAKRPLDTMAEAIVINYLSGLTRGRLRIITPSTVYNFPTHAVKKQQALGTDEVVGDASDLDVELRVLNDEFWLRVLTTSDLGFSEAYMMGEIECDDLTSLFMIFIYNRDALAAVSSFKYWLNSIPSFMTSSKLLDLTAALATLNNARANVTAHYDMSNRMFEAFLSQDMLYSCPIYATVDGDLLPPEKETKAMLMDTLEMAQVRKLRYIIRKTDIRDGHRVLEIGTGWGSFAIAAAGTCNCTVDTITLSEQQAAAARERIAKAGLSDRITVHVVDYRNLPAEWAGKFDRFVSIEMIEHVGVEFYETYFGMINWALKKNGVGYVQSSTLPDSRKEAYAKDVDFIRKHVFPGGHLPSMSDVFGALNTASKGTLIIDSVINLAPHYPRTIRDWRRRFLENFETIIWPELLDEYDLTREECETFKRKWLYYFCYSEAGFATRTLGCHAFTFTREGNVDLPLDFYV